MAELAESQEMMVVSSQQNFTDYNDTNLLALFRNFRTLTEIKSAENERTRAKVVEERKVFTMEQVEDIANSAEKKNNELKARTLLILRSTILEEDSPEEMLNKTMRTYPDHSLADEALDFLIETTEGKVQNGLKIAKEQLGLSYGREIKAGRNIGSQAREFSQEGLGSPTSLRDLYRDITGTPREPLKLFEELTEKFNYEKLSTVISFLLHSLGADLKAKGPSIIHAELLRLIGETKSLQGILGIFRFFQSRMNLIRQMCASYDLEVPPKLNFEMIARAFTRLLGERFVNPEKVLQFLRLLGLPDKAALELVICTQWRDAVKQIAPRYYRNMQHRDELSKAIRETLDDLEDIIEDEEEEE